MPPSQTTERTYYDEPSLREFTATVSEIRELSRNGGVPLFQVALDRTAFYPTGGGQPCDTGMLLATARSGAVLAAPIEDVIEDDAGEVWHTTAKPLQPGTSVVGRIDAARRDDHTQQHTGQHLLSAVAARDLRALTVGFHMGADTSTVDLAVPALSSEQIAGLQHEVNRVVMQSLAVTQRWVTCAEAEALLAAGILRKLPSREGDFRVITIGDLDQNACGGTHVSNTAQIGPVLLRRTEKVRGNTRLHFICGGRALLAASADHALLSSLAAALSTAPAQLQERVTGMQQEIRAARKAAKRPQSGPQADTPRR